MKKHVVLVLEYDMGDYADMEAETGEIPTVPRYWEDIFFQRDVFVCDMDIKAVRIEERD